MAESPTTRPSPFALRQLGYSVPEHDAGATVYGILPGNPRLPCPQGGDVITSVDGGRPPIPPFASVTRTHQPGQTITLRRLHRPPDTGNDVTRVWLRFLHRTDGALSSASRTWVPARVTTFPSPSRSIPIRSAVPPPAWPGPSGSFNTLSGGHLDRRSHHRRQRHHPSRRERRWTSVEWSRRPSPSSAAVPPCLRPRTTPTLSTPPAPRRPRTSKSSRCPVGSGPQGSPVPRWPPRPRRGRTSGRSRWPQRAQRLAGLTVVVSRQRAKLSRPGGAS